jgi:uncharacterized membrane protein YeaQ/YmgE (transglycosylase-associated protein family)
MMSLSRLWNGSTITTPESAVDPSSSSSSVGRSILEHQRVIIDEQQQEDHHQYVVPPSQPQSPSMLAASSSLPIVIADNVLGPPNATTSRSGGGGGGGDDVILETTPLIHQQAASWSSRPPPATNGQATTATRGGGLGEASEAERLLAIGGASSLPSSNDTATIMNDETVISPVYRDVPFAIVFALHCGIMAWLGIWIAPIGYTYMDHFDVKADIDWNDWKEQLEFDWTEDDLHMMESFMAQTVAYLQVYPTRIFVWLILPCIVLAFVAGWLVTALGIRPCPQGMIYSYLIGSMVGACSITILALVSFIRSDNDDVDYNGDGGGDNDDHDAESNGNIVLVVILTVALLGGLAYRLRVYYWPRVAFCAVNLRVALIGIGRNYGTYVVAFTFAVLGFAWVLYWIYVFVGTIAFTTHQCRLAHPDANFDTMLDDNYDDVCDPPLFMILLFLLSLYWTNTVIMVSIPSVIVIRSSDSSCNLLVVSILVCSNFYTMHSR